MKKNLFIRCASLAMAALMGIGAAAPAIATEEEPPIPLTTYYSSAEFEAQYTYEGNDLGAVWTPEKTTFRVWAPTATAVSVNLFESGTPGIPDLIDTIPMTPDINGTWVLTVEEDLNGVYYTYLVDVNGQTNEACDPYARTTGVNGMRAMVIDLASTNPEGWDEDADPHAGNNITDAIIYELHVRDLSVDENSGITNKGKFLGLIETGTTNAAGIPTGLDHIKNLGITHLHILPSYDYKTVDESKLDTPQFNWGYDPQNYNVPEGSYSTDPFNGEVRVSEFKQMVKGLHDNGISVIMDVVYNHVYDANSFCFNQLVPQYFSRVSPNGTVSQVSGCGNDTASERSMVKKYIVDSVCYWADEYHIDGFRFDLVGLIDTETINAVIEEVHKTHPNVIFYGEGWKMDSTLVTKDGYTLTNQHNSTQTPEFAFFSDTLRDALRGPMGDDYKGGFVSGVGGYANNVANCILGAPNWCKSPTQSINYASCHDNLALFDKITMSTHGKTQEERIQMNNLAAAVVMLSQGVPFFQAGEEMLRSKPTADGKFDHNSYKSSDEVNSLKWDHLNDEAYQQVRDYYAGLIAFRKAHPGLRMTSAEDVSTNITRIRDGVPSNMIVYEFAANTNGEDNYGMYAIFSGMAKTTTVPLPAGTWTIYINDQQAGTTALGTAEGSVDVAPTSAMFLIREEEPPVEDPTEPSTPPATEPSEPSVEPTNPSETQAPTTTAPAANNENEGGSNLWLYVIIGVAAVLVAVGIIAFIVIKKRKQN